MGRQTASSVSLPIVCILSVASAVAQSTRFTACIEEDGIECVVNVCDTHITVQPSRGVDCSALNRNNRSLDGTVCNRLVDAIEIIATKGGGGARVSTCIAVDVYPTESGAPHVIPVGDASTRVISESVVFRGVSISEDNGRRRRQAGSRMPPPATTSPPTGPPLV